MDTLCSAGGSILVYTRTFTYTLRRPPPPHSVSFFLAVGGVWNTRNVHKLRFALSSLRHIIYHPEKKKQRTEFGVGKFNAIPGNSSIQILNHSLDLPARSLGISSAQRNCSINGKLLKNRVNSRGQEEARTHGMLN